MALKGYIADIETKTEKNQNFREVLYTSNYLQLVLMTLKPGESIGREVHASDQFFRFDTDPDSYGEVHVDDTVHEVKDGMCVVAPSGCVHNIVNTSKKPLTFYTVYALPNHPDKMVCKTKAEAEKNDKPFDGWVSEHHHISSETRPKNVKS